MYKASGLFTTAQSTPVPALDSNFGVSNMKLIFFSVLSLNMCALFSLTVNNRGFVVVDLLFIVTYVVGICNCPSFAVILIGKRELVAFLSLSSWCLVIVVWLFLVMPWVHLQFLIVVFPGHTHLLFLTSDH